MVKIITSFLFVFVISMASYAQNVLQEVELPNKQTILLFENNTWEYKDKLKNKKLNQPIKMLDEIRMHDGQIALIYNDYVWLEKLETEFGSNSGFVDLQKAAAAAAASAAKEEEAPKAQERVDSEERKVYYCGARIKGGICKMRVYKKGARCWKHAK